MLLDKYIINESIPFVLYTLISVGITFSLITIYDITISRETKREMSQIARNTLDIKYIQEDVQILQAIVHEESMLEVRAENARRVADRRKRGNY